MNNSLMSKYIPLDTVIHRLDPRAKLFFVLVYVISVFLAFNQYEFIVLTILLFYIEWLSKVNFFYLVSGFKAISLLIIFTSLVHIIFNKTGEVVFTLLNFSVYKGAITSIILLTIRFFLVVAIMVIFTISTSPTQITNAIEKSLGFLNKINIPVGTFALLMSISLRFIPTIGEETNRIMNAQISRGANLKTAGIMGKIKNFTPILIPIFIATLKRADELATAMEVRGYDPDKKRTKYKELKYNKFDYMVYILAILVILLMFFL